MTQPVLPLPPDRVRRVAFLGTPAAAVPCLRALVAAGYDVPLVVSQPDRRRGRGSRLNQSPVKQTALELGLAVEHDPEKLLTFEAIDLAVVVAYGRIFRRGLLERVPMVNVHFSLLPRWRGAAPVQRAILAGDATTGVSVMQLVEGLDEGPVYATMKVPVDAKVTAQELTSRLAAVGAELLVTTMERGLVNPTPQHGEVTYAHKLDRAEFELDLTLPALDVHRRIRLGRSWTTFRGRRLGIEEARPVNHTSHPGQVQLLDRAAIPGTGPDSHSAVVLGTGDQGLELVMVKPEGRRAMSATDWWNGAKPQETESIGG